MSPRKRQLRFSNSAQVIAEIQRLKANGYTQTKNWNLGQICQHLTMTMQGEMEGLGFRLPWLLRKTIGRWLTAWVLKRESMPSVPTLPSLKPKIAKDAGYDDAISECISTLKRTEEFDGSLEDYPFVDGLTHEQWRKFMWIHAAHHLAFLTPSIASTDCSE